MPLKTSTKFKMQNCNNLVKREREAVVFPEVSQHYSSLALTHSCSLRVFRLRLAFSSVEVYVGQRENVSVCIG